MHVLEPAWEALKREWDSACTQMARAARSQTVSELNQTFRRLQHYDNEGEWIAAMLDGSSKFAKQTALFTVADGLLHLRGQRGLSLPEALEFAPSSAGAFGSAIETRDPVVAMRTAGEVGEALAGTEPDERAHLFPIANAGRVVAVLFAAGQDYLDVNGLELSAGMAASVLERQTNLALHAQIAPAPGKVSTLPVPSEQSSTADTPKQFSARAALPPWASLSDSERELHIKAQRFSRVAVAEMQLAQPEVCRAAREHSNIYALLHRGIDKARDTYRIRFMTVPSMVDYLHLELVRTAAEGDELKLGADYPGQLV